MRLAPKILTVLFLLLLAASVSFAQTAKPKKQAQEFGPNVQAYLDYLKNELTVTDAHESQREVSPEYIRHNFNRVSALRQFAIKLASESEVDYVPEMEAVALREFPLLFTENAPKPADLKSGEIYSSFRYLGSVRSGREIFYIFCRLDPFEEEARNPKSQQSSNTAAAPKTEEPTPEKPETKPPVNESNAETPRLTRERILYGAGENKNKNPQKQPNQ